MNLNEMERQNLLLHIISKVEFIDGYSKLYNLIYLLREEIGEEFSDYKFDNQFLTIKDNVLDNDLNTLILQNFVDNDFIDRELAHQHIIKIKNDGLNHLKVQKIDKKLKKKIGKKTLKKIDSQLKKFNDMPTNNIMQLVKGKTQHNS